MPDAENCKIFILLRRTANIQIPWPKDRDWANWNTWRFTFPIKWLHPVLQSCSAVPTAAHIFQPLTRELHGDPVLQPCHSLKRWSEKPKSREKKSIRKWVYSWGPDPFTIWKVLIVTTMKKWRVQVILTVREMKRHPKSQQWVNKIRACMTPWMSYIDQPSKPSEITCRLIWLWKIYKPCPKINGSS